MKTTAKRLAGILLSLAVIFTLLPAGMFTVKTAAYAAGDIITFGSYPQTKVTDSSLITALNAQTPNSDNIVIYGGSKYKRVFFETTTDSNQADNGYFINTVYWFKFEPIEWRILSNVNGELFVLAERILDSRQYNQVYAYISWETSTMRTWINNVFYNTAFNVTEQTKIETSTVVNEDNPLFDTEGGNDTLDKVFLLSLSEIQNPAHGFSSYYGVDSAREAQGSDFAKSNGLWVSSNLENSNWWLRSPGFNRDDACTVHSEGAVSDNAVSDQSIGCRPALRLNLTSKIITSKAGSGCVVDSTSGTIYGLEPGITQSQFENDYVQVMSGYTLQYSSGAMGTGRLLEVLDNDTVEILEFYTFIIFGDTNGDGSINAVDADICALVQYWMIEWDETEDAAFIKAADVNGDGRVDAVDADIITLHENWMVTIDQTTGRICQPVPPCPESGHPYADGMDHTWTYTHPEPVSYLGVTFSSSTFVEWGNDFIYVYDGSYNLVRKYSDNELSGKTVIVPGNTFHVRLTSDGSGTGYGFSITEICEASEEDCFVIEDGVLTAYRGLGGDVTIPDSVTSIGESAFYECSNLSNIIISDNVTSIGNNAFSGCTSLTGVTFGSGVTSIGNYSFYNCSGLTSLIIPGSVTSIGSFAFDGCSGLSDITIPDNVTSIGNGAFYGCIGLTNILIGDGVQNLDAFDFCNYSLLSNVVIGNSVTSIGNSAFYNCAGLTGVTIGSGVTSIGEYAFCGCAGLTGVTIGSGVTSIGGHSFMRCTGLTNITIPQSVTSIGDSAFEGCAGLTSVAIPNGVTRIANRLFYDCKSLTDLLIPDGVISIGDRAFSFCSSLTNLVIPDSVISIGEYAFNYCFGLKTAAIPVGVTSIGICVFSDCSGLTDITIPDSVTSIGFAAFSGCRSLTDITIPDSVTSIGDSAFYQCSSLTTVTIPVSVELIGAGAFFFCRSLTSIIAEENNPSFSSQDGALFNKDKSVLIQCPGGKSGTYTIPDTVASFEPSAFFTCNKISSILVSENNPSYSSQDGVLYNKEKSILIQYPGGREGSFIIQDTVTSIAFIAFANCIGLTSVTIGNNVNDIGTGAFYGCGNLSGVTIPETVTSIGDLAFEGCDDVTIYGEPGSYAQTYANANGIPFCSLPLVP